MEGKATAWERLTRIDVRIWDGLLAAAALVNAQLDLWLARGDIGPGEREPDLLAAAILVVATVPLYERRRRPVATATVVAAAAIAFGALQRPATETLLPLAVARLLGRRLPATIRRPDARDRGARRRVCHLLDGWERQLGRDGERRVLHGGRAVRVRSDRVEPPPAHRSGARGGGARCRRARAEPDRTRAPRRGRAQHERHGRAGGSREGGPPPGPGRGRARAQRDRGRPDGPAWPRCAASCPSRARSRRRSLRNPGWSGSTSCWPGCVRPVWRSSWSSRATSGRCRPASTCPPTASSRRRSRTR